MIKFLWKYRGFYLYTVFKIRCTEKRDIKLFIDIALIVMRFKQALSFPCSGATSPSSVGGPWAMAAAARARGCDVAASSPCYRAPRLGPFRRCCRPVAIYLTTWASEQCNAMQLYASHHIAAPSRAGLPRQSSSHASIYIMDSWTCIYMTDNNIEKHALTTYYV